MVKKFIVGVFIAVMMVASVFAFAGSQSSAVAYHCQGNIGTC